jgi:hypothetical protein
MMGVEGKVKILKSPHHERVCRAVERAVAMASTNTGEEPQSEKEVINLFQAGGLLRTHHGARLTFVVEAHTNARSHGAQRSYPRPRVWVATQAALTVEEEEELASFDDSTLFDSLWSLILVPGAAAGGAGAVYQDQRAGE